MSNFCAATGCVWELESKRVWPRSDVTLEPTRWQRLCESCVYSLEWLKTLFHKFRGCFCSVCYRNLLSWNQHCKKVSCQNSLEKILFRNSSKYLQPIIVKVHSVIFPHQNVSYIKKCMNSAFENVLNHVQSHEMKSADMSVA